MIRKATLNDVKQIHGLLQIFAQQGELLPRPLSQLYDHIRDFWVYVEEDEVLGCCALQICWEDLAEIRSLAVNPKAQHKRVATRFMDLAVAEARDYEIKKLFTLTYVPEFFKRFEFKLTDRSRLPQKIWADCINCVKFPDCDEIAMMRQV